MLYNSVIPCKMNERLMFVLCRTCGETCESGDCTHNIDERALNGTWVIAEIRRASSKGYMILNIVEIWNYETVQYDLESGTQGLFNKMMDKFLKMKQQTSGWLSNCLSPSEKHQYIKEYKLKEGIELESEAIPNNKLYYKTVLERKLVILTFALYTPGCVKMNERLMFVLCRTCGETCESGDCTHNINERALNGTWVIAEIRRALSKGYMILNIVEIWKYETVQYDLESGTQGLFNKMMDKFLKMKQQASGWPSNCLSPSEKHQYIKEYKLKEGIELESEAILNNSGLRSLAKLMLNSFWGKFGQREIQPKTTIMNQSHELFNMLTNPSVLVNAVEPVNEETIVVNWEYKEEAAHPMPTVKEGPPVSVTTRSIQRTEDRNVVTKTGTKVFRPTFMKRKRIENYDSVPYGYKKKKTL